MNKRTFIGLASVGVLLFGLAAGSADNSQTTKSSSVASDKTAQTAAAETQSSAKAKPICDGTKVTAHCTVDGVNYSTYVYHPAEPEKSHTETVTTYERKVTGYCTLCNDDTYSPSCATGRGACSHHGGVKEWNAPRYASVPVDSTKTVVDAPAKEAYYDKVAE